MSLIEYALLIIAMLGIMVPFFVLMAKLLMKLGEPPRVEFRPERTGRCDYPDCGALVGNDWDTRCVEHSYRSDAGKP